LHGRKDRWVFIDGVQVSLQVFGEKDVEAWWQKPGERSVVKHLQHPMVFQIYGAVSREYRMPLIFLSVGKSPARFDSRVFCQEVLVKVVEYFDARYGKNQWSLIRDHAPQHVSSFTLQFCDGRVSILTDFPPQGQDINIIENAWSMLKSALRAKSLPNNITWVQRAINRAWDSITQVTLAKCVDSLDERLADIIANQGEML
jgi:hypothetical protein